LSQERNIVIIGCGAGGGTASQFARKTDRKASIEIFEKGAYPQYSKCGLPYTISDRIPKINDLIEFTEDWFKKANINLHLQTEVNNIDVKNNIITAKNEDEIIEQPYTSLIIATGSTPYFPPIKNIFENKKLINGIYSVRTINDAKNIISHVKKEKKATIIGAGLIGLEMADCLNLKGMDISVIEALPDILSSVLDLDMSKPIKEKLTENIDIYTDHLVIDVKRESDKLKYVIIKDNQSGEQKKIQTDLLIIATGTKQETNLAEQAGCKIGSTNGICVNENSETSVKNIYAVGDCTEYFDFVTKRSATIGLGSLAVRQGIAAGINSAGGSYILPRGFLFTSTSEFFNIEVASAGPTSTKLNDDLTISGRYNGLSLPDYFPGGKPITMKVVIDKKNRLYSCSSSFW